MSVYYSDKDQEYKHGGMEIRPDAFASKQECFFCGKRAGYPSVVWIGFGAEITLHPKCVVELTIRLYRDLHEIECKAKKLTHGYVTE